MRIAAAATCIALVLSATCAVGARAQDTEIPRFYLHLRGADTNPVTEVRDHWGLSLGANLGRFVGAELSVDTFERHVDKGGNTLGEYGVVALVPQARLRYPVFSGRLVPYLVGGVGVAFGGFNDQKPQMQRVFIDGASDAFPVATAGIGVEYYFAENLAAGVELKRLFAGDQTFRIDGERHAQQVASTFLTLGLRLLVPERPARPAPPPDPFSTRLYLGLRAGGAIATDTHSFSGVEIRPEPPAYFSTANQLFGAALGVDFRRHLGVELAADGYEIVLATPDLGSVTEVAVMHLIPQVRVRYPLLDGRVVPYAIGGVGAGYIEVNDRKQPGRGLDIEASRWGVAAALGAGVDYFVARNIAVGVETRYLTNRGHTVRIGNRESTGHYDAVTFALTLRVFLARLGP
jgi:opacity protein-like surface antigen